jgi:hypothetical protein
MNYLTLQDLRRAGMMLEVECIRCGRIERRETPGVKDGESTAMGELGLSLSCPACHARACIVSPAQERS